MNFLLKGYLFAFVVDYVSGHGMMLSPNTAVEGLVRAYDKISFAIDDLRNPTGENNVCRGEPVGPITDITLPANGEDYTINLALSVGAMHTGPCQVVILDRNDLNAVGVEIGSHPDCARINAIDTKAGATSVCPGPIPPKLVTNDMCVMPWTFKVKNVEQISCVDCVLQFKWEGKHISPSEHFNTCADVNISNSGGSGGSSSTTGGTSSTASSSTQASTPSSSATVNSSSSTSPPANTTPPPASSTTTITQTSTPYPSSTSTNQSPEPTNNTDGGSENEWKVGDACENVHQIACLENNVAIGKCNFGKIVKLSNCPAPLKCKQFTNVYAVCDWA